MPPESASLKSLARLGAEDQSTPKSSKGSPRISKGFSISSSLFFRGKRYVPFALPRKHICPLPISMKPFNLTEDRAALLAQTLGRSLGRCLSHTWVYPWVPPGLQFLIS